MKANFIKRIAILILISFLLSGCGASTYKKATSAFSSATKNTFSGYDYILLELENSLLKSQSRQLDGTQLNNYASMIKLSLSTIKAIII